MKRSIIIKSKKPAVDWSGRLVFLRKLHEKGFTLLELKERLVRDGLLSEEQIVFDLPLDVLMMEIRRDGR